MANSISAVKDTFVDDTARGYYNAALTARSLPTLSTEVPIRRHRDQLPAAAAFPALAVELGQVEATDEGAGGLRAMTGEATLYLAVGGADETALFDRIEQYVDALREAVELHLAANFQRLTFTGALVEGAVLAGTGVTLRVVPLTFRFHWLYLEGEY